MPTFESASLNSIANQDPKLIEQVREKLAAGGFTRDPVTRNRRSLESVIDPRPPRMALDAMSAAEAQGGLSRASLEAIVVSIIRPPLLVRNGTFVPPNAADTVPEVMATVATFTRDTIDPVIARTGRVELANLPGVPYIGTGWIVEKPTATKAIIVTNRHVAQEFARASRNGGYAFRTLPNFLDYEARIDFREEHLVDGHAEVAVVRVAFIAGDHSPDIALLEAEGELLRGLSGIELATAPLKTETRIGVVGYPAYDSRNDPDDVLAYFGDIFDVKRFSFGNVTGVANGRPEFTHDATTLGGNSGSCIFDRETGEAVGLHFAGDYKKANYAVPVAEIAAALRGLRSSVVVPPIAAIEARGDGRSPPSSFRGRDGYDPAFLKTGSLAAPQPGSHWADDIAAVEDADSPKIVKELKYRHFSVWMSKSRRLPLITAVNIDGTIAKRLGRVDKWYIDGRLGDSFQLDNGLYASNPLDRGHMVRREDPVWGTLDVAAEANTDTFHYTNAAPQHEDLNQRDWLRLEDYVLGNARTRGLKVSVFTGPVLGDDDRDYKGIARIPGSFWKIVAVVDDETDKLSVTGYVLAQGDLIRGLTSEFVYGPFATYQVEVEQIGALARLDVSHLVQHDPLRQARRQEGVSGNVASFRMVNGPGDLLLFGLESFSRTAPNEFSGDQNGPPNGMAEGGGADGGVADAGGLPDSIHDIALDSLPDEVVATIQLRDKFVSTLRPRGEAGLEFVVEDMLRWLPGQTVRVAFLDGDKDLHADVAQATREITEACHLFFDFGVDTDGNHRRWTESDSKYAAEIRVSFDKVGYFSLVGTDSIDTSIGKPEARVGGRPHQASLNLGGFAAQRPASWRGTVRHEFLHAVGFHHAHQNMRGPCEGDFRWDDDPGYIPTQDQNGGYVSDSNGRRPGIYTLLAGAPNFWPKAKVDFNLRTAESPDLVAGPFDNRSVMLYRFPTSFYKTGSSNCAPIGDGQSLSDGDRRGLRLLYPRSASEANAVVAAQKTLADRFEAALPASTRGEESARGRDGSPLDGTLAALRAKLNGLRR